RLAMVAARCGDDSLRLRPLALEPVEIDDAAAHLEGADGRVVLMLDHDLDAGLGPEQRPGILRRRRHTRAHQWNDFFKFGQAEHAGRISFRSDAPTELRAANP